MCPSVILYSSNYLIISKLEDRGLSEPRALQMKRITLIGLNDDLFTGVQTFIQLATKICHMQPLHQLNMMHTKVHKAYTMRKVQRHNLLRYTGSQLMQKN